MITVPDFYAAQTFHGVPVGEPPVLMAWMNSWRYSNDHPSSGRRGVLSLPRALAVDSMAEPVLRCRPAVDLSSLFTGPPATVGAGPILARGSRFEVTVRSEYGVAAEVRSDGETVVLERHDIGVDGIATMAEIPAGGSASVLVDHGTVEVFAASGKTMSALVFPGAEWAVTASGDTRTNTLA